MGSARTAFTQMKERNSRTEREQRRAMSRQGMAPRVNVGTGERVVSALAGGLLTMWGLRRKGAMGYGAAALGAELLYRGTSGHCHAYTALGITTRESRPRGQAVDVNHEQAVDVRHSVTIQRPAAELFAIWRDFSTLPQFMPHLERVDVLSPTLSHWVTRGPIGTTVEWDAEIVDEREGEWIAWRAVEPAQVPNNGTVMFRDLGGDRTEVFVTLEAQPPAGKLGDMVARMFGRSPQQEVRAALERFRDMVEAGHTFEGAPRDWNEREVALRNEGLSDATRDEGTAPGQPRPSYTRRPSDFSTPAEGLP